MLWMGRYLGQKTRELGDRESTQMRRGTSQVLLGLLLGCVCEVGMGGGAGCAGLARVVVSAPQENVLQIMHLPPIPLRAFFILIRR